METKEILHNLRTQSGLSQDELAEKLYVTRQAVSRWETGETIPNTDTLKLLSKLFNVSINTLLGSPRQLFCQCCGMPLEDGITGKDENGDFNEDYCKWCYADGEFTYSNMDDLIEVCVHHMASDNFTEDQARSYLKESLPKLEYWKNHDELGNGKAYEVLKKQLIKEFNELNIPGLPKVEKLNALVGAYVNLEYPLPNGHKVKLLDDEKTYLGNQFDPDLGDGRLFGILANKDFLLVSSYGKDGIDPEIVLFKKR